MRGNYPLGLHFVKNLTEIHCKKEYFGEVPLIYFADHAAFTQLKYQMLDIVCQIVDSFNVINSLFFPEIIIIIKKTLPQLVKYRW